MTISLLIVHPFDPWGGKIGGIETMIRATMRHTPEDCKISLIGVTENPIIRPVGQWREMNYGQTPISFLPIMQVPDPNRRPRIPLFLNFSLRLFKYRLSLPSTIALFHRVEPLYCSQLAAAANVLFIHGDPREITGPFSEVRWKHVPRLYRYVEKQAIKKAVYVFVVSRKGAEYMQNRYARYDDISFFPTGYCEEIFYLPAEEEWIEIRKNTINKYNLNPSARYVLFAGRFELQKNPILALETFAKAASQVPDVELLLAGQGNLRAEMERKIKHLQLENRIHFLGPLSPADLADVMRISHVLLMTSHFEGMPILVHEAQACGLPVVSTDVGEIHDMIQPGITGQVVSDYDGEALAQVLLDFLNRSDNNQKIQCAKNAFPFRINFVLGDLYEMIRKIAPAS
jgi:glycosyltransferase involved in cell wall biosynthesis